MIPHAVIIDTEYTTWPGALESGWSGPDQHREIVQIGAVLVDPNFYEMECLDLMVHPTINPEVSELFLSLTGLDQREIDEGVDFATALATVHVFTDCGAIPVICMNADEAVFRENCRINELEFPLSSFHRLRPLLEERGIDLTKYSSGDLHKLTDFPIFGHTHNALHDVRSMARWIGANRVTLDQLPTGAPLIDPRSSAALRG